MKTSNNGLLFIKRHEGCRLRAYKCFTHEKYFTIGYGHYGQDVKAGMTITQAQADELLRKDLARFEKAVNKVSVVKGKQNVFDALVSFTYNCGENNLVKLTNGRDLKTIADKIVLYNKSGGVVINGLTKRRIEEQKLMLLDLEENNESYYPQCATVYRSIVDALKSIGVDSSFANRKKIAVINGISNYTGTASENVFLLTKLKNGTLRK